MKLRMDPQTDTLRGLEDVLVTAYDRTATGRLLSSVDAGMRGLNPLTVTLTGRSGSESRTCPKGYAALNEASLNLGSP